MEASSFIIIIDHQSIKRLLEQKLHTTFRHRGVATLLGLEYTNLYKKGSDNRVADALSWQGEGNNMQLMAISAMLPSWKLEVQDSYESDDNAKKLIQELVLQQDSHNPYSIIKGYFTRRKIVHWSLQFPRG